jgi:uncharacterized protein
VRLHEDELPVVNHPAFQHLGYVYQLGQTFLVYRGATHSRLEHALGTRAVADMMIEALKRNCAPEGAVRLIPKPAERVGQWALDKPLGQIEERFVRLSALLHDIGHVPAGHTLEDELGRLDSHDRPARLTRVWDRVRWNGAPTVPLRSVINDTFAREAKSANLFFKPDPESSDPRTRTGAQLLATDIVELLISKEPAKIQRQRRFRIDVCRDIIGNTICADLLDYLHRDWHHIGKGRTFDQRLLEYIEIRTKEVAASDENEGGPDARLVINLRSGHRIRTDAVTAILDLLESRYQLSEIALFHKTKVLAAAMLERAVAELTEVYRSLGREEAFLDDLEERLLDASDTKMLDILEELADAGLSETTSGVRERRAAVAAIKTLTRALRERRLHKHLSSTFEYQLPQTAKVTQDLYVGPGKGRASAREGAANRLKAVRLLEQDFGMKRGSLVMYCPPREMNSKIAEVQVLIHSDVHSLADFERREPDHGITGGHLAAQQQRFRRLWRIQIGIEVGERDRLNEAHLLEALGRAIDRCVLGSEPTVGTFQGDVVALARELTRLDDSGLVGREVRGDEEIERIAARQAPSNRFPNGTARLRAYTVRRPRAASRD